MKPVYRLISSILALVLAGACPQAAAREAARVPSLVLQNPILAAPSQDPWLIAREGRIYQVHSDGRRICVRSAIDLKALSHAPLEPVWTAPAHGPNSQNLWAPEMHWLRGKWWIFYAADDGDNRNHRIFTLESRTADPRDGFEERGQWETGGWAIDPTVFAGDDGALYALWSGWPGAADGEQQIYLSRMESPEKLTGPRLSLTAPTNAWERVALPVCEGPQVLRRGGLTFLVYSASGSWTEDYCLGLLVHRGGDFTDPAAWKKQPRPVLEKTETVWGVGHCCFLSLPETGDLLFYHAKTRRGAGWTDRDVRVQPFTWRSDGLPDFGKPVDPKIPIAIFP